MMFHIRYLEYFIVSADVGSFSKAAEVLYTTQSNVSKGVKALEEFVGDRLFVRQSTGITLTPQGKHVYKYASKIMDDVGALKDFSKSAEEEWIHIATSPSSWMADRFVEFYNLHESEDLHWQVYTASVKHILRRIADYKDEVGFVYLTEGHQASFQYTLSRNHLEFVLLAEAEPMVYLGKKHPGFGSEALTEEDLQKLRFVQGYPDVFAPNDREQELPRRNVAVVTNSDYIMERLLQHSRLANISSGRLTSEDPPATNGGIPYPAPQNGPDSPVTAFGYLKREKEDLSRWTKELIHYIQDTLK